ncbi:unnamed protein product [Calicophoron daubneyi]|uniref:Uncharacterized protein n=1 Tax=Calicophoron daubneyi TaxID=300641 RepID=A0AAV2T678_CALDB
MPWYPSFINQCGGARTDSLLNFQTELRDNEKRMDSNSSGIPGGIAVNALNTCVPLTNGLNLQLTEEQVNQQLYDPYDRGNSFSSEEFKQPNYPGKMGHSNSTMETQSGRTDVDHFFNSIESSPSVTAASDVMHWNRPVFSHPGQWAHGISPTFQRSIWMENTGNSIIQSVCRYQVSLADQTQELSSATDKTVSFSGTAPNSPFGGRHEVRDGNHGVESCQIYKETGNGDYVNDAVLSGGSPNTCLCERIHRSDEPAQSAEDFQQTRGDFNAPCTPAMGGATDSDVPHFAAAAAAAVAFRGFDPATTVQMLRISSLANKLRSKTRTLSGERSRFLNFSVISAYIFNSLNTARVIIMEQK